MIMLQAIANFVLLGVTTAFWVSDKVICSIGKFYPGSNWEPSEANDQEETELCRCVNAQDGPCSKGYRGPKAMALTIPVSVRHTFRGGAR